MGAGSPVRNGKPVSCRAAEAGIHKQCSWDAAALWQKKDWSKYMGGSGMGGMDFQQYMDYQLLGWAIGLSFRNARLSAS